MFVRVIRVVRTISVVRIRRFELVGVWELLV